jgi:hypothetical protein
MAEEAHGPGESGKTAWYDAAWFKWAVVIGFGGLIAGKCVQVLAVKNKGQDFAWHLGLGQTVLDGTPYVLPDGKLVGDHYLPGRVLIDAGLQLLTLKGAQALSLAVMVWGMWVMARAWGRMAEGVRPAGKGVHLAALALSFLMLAPWVVRDFDEAGLQFLLLLMLTLAGWCVYQGRQMAGGAWLALAITFKSTPVLFLPLLLYKRQWWAAGATVLFLGVFNVMVPGIIWGPEKTQEALGRYVEKMREVSKVSDPSENGIETPKHQNQSLPFAIARYLQTYPVGHPLYFHEKFDGDPNALNKKLQEKPELANDEALRKPHWGFVQFLDLEPRAAKRVIMGVLGVIALGLAWRMRKRWGIAPSGVASPQSGVDLGGKKTSALAPEWAVACAFAALMSPLTWLHHLTLVLPCGYLVIRDVLQRGAEGRRQWRLVGLAMVVICVWVLQRDPLPKQLAILAMSYHDDVLACLILVVMALTVRDGVPGSGARLAGGENDPKAFAGPTSA